MMPKKLLVIDDDANELELMKLALSGNEPRVDITTAMSGPAGLRLLNEAEETFNAVILDLNMPEMDGLEVLRKLRMIDRYKKLPVVMFTSSNDPGDINSSYANGVNSYVEKPEEFEKFKQVVVEISHYWTEVNQSTI